MTCGSNSARRVSAGEAKITKNGVPKFGKFLAMDKGSAEALEMVNDTVEGFLTSKIVHSDAKKRGLDLKILNFLIELYENPKSLDEAKEIFQTDSIEEDIKFNF